jgi:signal transduction histidine kinase
MRLVAKLTLALVLGMSAVLALFGYRSVHRERALLDAYRHRNEALVVHALSAAVGEVWRRDGREAALRLIADADAHTDGHHLRWVWLDAPPGHPAAPAVRFATPLAPAELHRVERDAREQSIVYAQVDVGEGRAGAIELSESLAEQEQIVRAAAWSSALTVLALAALGGVLALGLGAYFVGRPVEAIVSRTRRIGQGDLSGAIALHRNDELGYLAHEVDLMAERLARETAARLAALDQLRHADRLNTVGKLASGIAHELGTPLNVVGGRAKRILRAAPSAEADARIIVEQADRMAKIIRQLLDFARRRVAHKAPADLGAMAREVLALLEPIAQKARVRLGFSGDEVDARTDVDAAQLQQALTNLVMNGIQAMPEGGELTVALSRARRAPPRGGPEAEFLSLRVADTGMGISAEHLPHVFEPFFTTKDVGEGTGLGLSVTWGIVEEHGGFIEAESEPGRGAAFTVSLPVR